MAIQNVSCTLKPGVVGLLGANGAGKSTLMRMVCGVMKPTSGTVRLGKYDVTDMSYRNLLGYSKAFAITGGEFGIESSVISLIGYIIVAGIAFVMIKSSRKN